MLIEICYLKFEQQFDRHVMLNNLVLEFGVKTNVYSGIILSSFENRKNGVCSESITVR